MLLFCFFLLQRVHRAAIITRHMPWLQVATHPFGKAAKFFWRDFGGAWTVPLARTRPAKQATSFDVAEALEPTPTSTAANMAENSVAQSSTSVQESTSERSRAGASSMSSFDDEQLLLGNPPSPLSGTPLGESVVTGQWALVRMSRGRGLIRKGFQDFERAFLAVSDDGHLLILRGTYDSIQQPFVAFSQSGSASSPMQTFHISPQWEADAKERPDGRGGCSVVWSLVIPPNNAASLQHQSPAQAGNWRAAPNGSPPLAARIGQEANPFRGIEGHVVSVLFPSADKFRSFAAIVRVSQLLGQRPRDWSALSDHVRDQQVEAGVYARLLQASHKVLLTACAWYCLLRRQRFVSNVCEHGVHASFVFTNRQQMWRSARFIACCTRQGEIPRN